MHLQAKDRNGNDTSKLSCCTRRSYIFRVFSRYICLFTYLDKLYGKCMDLYAHAQTMDTRRSSPIFQAPGYEANSPSAETCFDTERSACPRAAAFLSRRTYITPSTYVYTSFVSDLVLAKSVAVGKTPRQALLF